LPHEPLLDALFDSLAGTGGSVPLRECAALLLKSPPSDTAARILEPMVKQDPRFLLNCGRVFLSPRKGRAEDEPLSSIEFAVLDFETNGFAPDDRAIEVGVACFRGGREIERFDCLVNPGTGISRFVQRLTGIQESDLEGRPGFEEIWPDLSNILNGRILTAHNLPFDRRILRKEIQRIRGGRPRIGENGICTLKLARRLLPKGESKRLDALADRFGFSFEARHRAYGDARVTGKLLYRLLEAASEEHPMETWADLRRLLAPAVRPGSSRSQPGGLS
jgi:DNA polymerase III subunit epsilon